MENKSLLIILLLLFTITEISAQSQHSVITGVIKTTSGIPLENVNVVLKETSYGSVTSVEGEFRIPAVPPGKYVLVVSRIGYELYETDLTTGSSSIVKLPVITLKEQASELPEILVQDSKRGRYNIDESEFVARIPLKNLENPQTYSTAPKELFLEQNLITPSAALSTIPGGTISTEDGIGVLGLYLRGFYTQGYIRNGLLSLSSTGGDIQIVEKYELIKGPSGPLYGTSGVSYGGLLNKVTKKPFPEKYINAGFTFGSYNLQRFTADINLPFDENKTTLFRLNAAVHSEGTFQDVGGRKTFLIAPAFSHVINNNLDLFLEAEINSIDLFAQTYFNGAPNLSVRSIDEIGMDYFRSYTSGMLNAQPSSLNNYSGNLNYRFSDKWKFSLGSAFSDFNLNGINIIPNFLNDSLLVRQVYDYSAQYNTVNIQPAINGEYLFAGMVNKMVIGVEYTWAYSLIDRFLDINSDTINYRGTNNPVLFIDPSHTGYELKFSEKQSLSEYAAFVSNNLTVTGRLNVLLSLRYTYFDHLGVKNLIAGVETTDPFNQSSLTPQAGFTYQIIPERISVFGNYMQGFSNIPINSQGQSFRPERAEQYETGLKFDISAGLISSTLSYYHITVDNKIRRDPVNPLLSIQDGTQFSRGIDVDIRSNTMSGLNFITGYAYNESRITKSDITVEGKRPHGTPKHMANFWGTYSLSGLLNGLGFGLGVIFSDDFYWNDMNTLSIPSYLLLKGSIFYAGSRYRVNLTSGNITNKRYWDFEGTPQDPRNVIVSLNLIL